MSNTSLGYVWFLENDGVMHGNSLCFHDDIIKWKHFPRYWPCAREIHRSSVISPHKGQWRGALMFSLIYARINGWVNKGEAGDLRRHRSHYPRIWVQSLTCSITTMQGTLLTIDTWHLCFHWYIFPSKFVWKTCFPILLAQGEIPASGSLPTSPPPLTKKTKSNRTGGGGGAALHLNQARGHLNWRMGLPALLGGNLGCRIV